MSNDSPSGSKDGQRRTTLGRRLRPRGLSLEGTLEMFTDRSGGPDACWPWTGSLDTYGYGKVSVNGRDMGAHKLALELRLGRKLVPGEVTRHRNTCQFRRCCNGDHLTPGTPEDNRQDMLAAGRHAHGETAGGVKLTAAQVAEIRLVLPTMGYGKFELLGRRYGVTGKEISRIARGDRWAPAPEPTP